MGKRRKEYTTIWAEAWFAVLSGALLFIVLALIAPEEYRKSSLFAIGVFGGLMTGLVYGVWESIVEYSRRRR
jgi:zinc transporter ZupT